MRREVLQSDLEKLYTANDMAKVGCRGCQGCWDCCMDMGQSAVLDPLDVFRLEKGLGRDFQTLMQECLELNAVDGMILPNLRMAGEDSRCCFLNRENRCAIHPHRPGVCRMFPLGRYYQGNSFRYFLQHQECRMEPKTKVKISKWLDTPELKKYERYVLQWHDFLEEVRSFLQEQSDEQLERDLNVYILEHFFAQPYGTEDFYGEFAGRLEQTKKLLQIMKK